MRVLLTILVVLVFVFTRLAAQLPAIRFENYSIAEGWPGHYSNTPRYDQHGYLWIPTSIGLFRYDGYEFKRYAHKRDDTTTLSSNLISTILIDDDGTIWAGTNSDGLNHMDPVTGRCQIYRFDKADQSTISSDKITTLYKDSKNRLWIGVSGSENSINLLEGSSGKFIRMNYNKEGNKVNYMYYEHRIIRDIKETHNHKILFGTVNGLWVYDDDVKIFKGYQVNYGNKVDPRLVVSAVKEDKNGNIWIGTLGGGLKKLDLNTGICESYIWNKEAMPTLLTNVCQDLEFKNDNELWISSVDSSFGMFNIKTKQFHFFKPDEYNNYKIFGYEFQPIYKDMQSNIWLKQGSSYARIDMDHQPFPFYNIKNLFFPNTPPFFASGFIKNDSTVLVGTWEVNGVLKQNFNSKIFHKVPYQSFQEKDIVFNYGFKFSKDALNNTWVISTSLFKLDTNDNELIEVKPYPAKKRIAFNDFSIDKQNQIWIASDSGLYCFDPQHKTWRTFTAQVTNKDSLQYNYIRSLYLDSDDKIWLGFDNDKGFSIYDRLTGKFTYYNCAAKDILVKSVDRIIEDKLDRIWMSGRSGITIWDKNKIPRQPVGNIACEESWGANRIPEMAKDTAGNVWAMSISGLQIINPLTLKVKSFSSYLPFFPINIFISLYISKDNDIFIGGKNGFFSFKPNDLKENNITPALVINSFKIFDEEKTVDFFHLKSELQLRYDQNHFSFEFAAPSLKDAGKNQYDYKLEGFDKDWVLAGTRHYAAYTNVPGGHYVFKVRAANADGTWNEKGLLVPLFISTPWWKQIWFYVLAMIIATAVIYGLYRYRITQYFKLQQMRTQIASDLHDDIGSSLTSISFYSEILKMQLPEEDVSQKNMLDKIGNNARTIVGTMSDIVWVINPDNDLTENLIRRMRNHATELCSERNIECHFETGNEEKMMIINMQQRKNLYLIYKEALHNAIKYACCTRIDIRILQTDHQLQLMVKDNGIGFNAAAFTEGNGLLNMKRRAAEIRARLDVDTCPNQGTSIVLDVKIT